MTIRSVALAMRWGREEAGCAIHSRGLGLGLSRLELETLAMMLVCAYQSFLPDSWAKNVKREVEKARNRSII